MPKGNPAGGPGISFGSKTRSRQQLDRRYRMELAIRFALLNPGAPTAEIAKHIGTTHQTLSNWMMSNEYKDLHNQLTTNVLDQIDSTMATDIKYQRLKLQRMVPLALQNLANLAVQQSDRKLQLEASLQILDREGNLSKVTRVGMPLDDQGGAGSKVDDDMAQELLKAFNSGDKGTGTSTPSSCQETGKSTS